MRAGEGPRPDAAGGLHSPHRDKGAQMAKGILIEEFHLPVYAPRGLPAHEYDSIRRTLDDAHFRVGLRRAVRRFCRRQPSLARVRVRLTR